MKYCKDYFVGVFYLVILNLFRFEWFKWENIIIVGVVFLLGREFKDLNEFFELVVDELKVLWKGVKIKVSLSRFVLMFCVVVLCVFFDVLVMRKICGFKGYLV